MKYLVLYIRFTQFGFSLWFPLCAFLVAGSRLQNAYGLGRWVMLPCWLLGGLTAVAAFRNGLRGLKKELKKTEAEKSGWNDHV